MSIPKRMYSLVCAAAVLAAFCPAAAQLSMDLSVDLENALDTSPGTTLYDVLRTDLVLKFDTNTGDILTSNDGSNYGVRFAGAGRLVSQGAGLPSIMAWDFDGDVELTNTSGWAAVVTGANPAAFLASGDISIERPFYNRAGQGPGGARADDDNSPSGNGYDAPGPLGGGAGSYGSTTAMELHYDHNGVPGEDVGIPGFRAKARPSAGGGFAHEGQSFGPSTSYVYDALPYPNDGEYVLDYTFTIPGTTGGDAETDFSYLHGGGGGGGSAWSYTGSYGVHNLGAGGDGGGAILFDTPGDLTVGTPTRPTNLRNDADEVPDDSHAGGGAGGYVVIQAGGTVKNYGFIGATGAEGATCRGGYHIAGMGSGGRIWIEAVNIENYGTFDVSGYHGGHLCGDGNFVNLGDVIANTALPGDANNDGKVSLADLSALAGNWGTPQGATWEMGDFSFDGSVSLADLSALAGNWGANNWAGPVSGAATSNVPEPATLALLTFGAVLLGRRRQP